MNKIDEAKLIHSEYKAFFDDNSKQILNLLTLRAEKFIEFIRYKYNIGIGDVLQHKTETFNGKPKIVWVLGYSAYREHAMRMPVLEGNKDLLTNNYVCLQGRMYDPVKGGYRRYKNIHNLSSWKVIGYRDPSLNGC